MFGRRQAALRRQHTEVPSHGNETSWFPSHEQIDLLGGILYVYPRLCPLAMVFPITGEVPILARTGRPRTNDGHAPRCGPSNENALLTLSGAARVRQVL